VAAVLPQDKELGHVVHGLVAGEAAALLHQREAGQLLVDADQERVTP
jgi:hypothetical protein